MDETNKNEEGRLDDWTDGRARTRGMGGRTRIKKDDWMTGRVDEQEQEGWLDEKIKEGWMDDWTVGRTRIKMDSWTKKSKKDGWMTKNKEGRLDD